MTQLTSRVLEREAFDSLIDALAARGYAVIAPTVRDGAIVYDEIATSAQLPIGLTDEQDGGRYRLVAREDDALFGYNVGPQSWKRFQLPASRRLWRGALDANGNVSEIVEDRDEPGRYAFLGVRSCELRAMGILDRVLLGATRPDPTERSVRANVFVVAVQCGQAGGTCFCVSMETGPTAQDGFDLALTEVLEEGRHYFVVQAGSNDGAELLAELPTEPARPAELEAATTAHERAAAQMGRELDITDIRDLLYRNYDHPRWDEVAERCLTCGNCTMVCPTCFCTTVEDVTDLAGTHVERHQRWDSCFTIDYSHIAGGAVRSSPRSRYRQWMTHKLATWIDQFGSSGCVGCGRCITWCPVGIDITEEARAIRASEEEPVASA